MDVASGWRGARGQAPAKLVILYERAHTMVGRFQQERHRVSETGQSEPELKQAKQKSRHSQNGDEAKTP